MYKFIEEKGKCIIFSSNEKTDYVAKYPKRIKLQDKIYFVTLNNPNDYIFNENKIYDLLISNHSVEQYYEEDLPPKDEIDNIEDLEDLEHSEPEPDYISDSELIDTEINKLDLNRQLKPKGNLKYRSQVLCIYGIIKIVYLPVHPKKKRKYFK